MTPLCAVEPMDCIYAVKTVAPSRRDLPAPPVAVSFEATEDGSPDPSLSNAPSQSEKILIISAAAFGSLLLIIGLILFFVCMKRRNASRKIGQLQDLSPTFLDHEKTKYFEPSSKLEKLSSSIPGPTPPYNVHHRTRSAPVAFAESARRESKGSTSKDRYHPDRAPSGPFQQISLTGEEDSYVESEDELALKRSLSKPGFRNRASTITIPHAALSTLHRSVSLNSHANTGYISRSAPIEEEIAQDPQDADALPTPTNTRFAESESPPSASKTRDHANPSRLSAGMGYQLHRGSFSSAMEFDPTCFSASSAVYESKRPFTRAGPPLSEDEDSDDASSSSSADGFDHLPAHQKPQSFETHHLYNGHGDKQDIEDEDVVHMQQTPQPSYNQTHSTTRHQQVQ
ncbi:hypothetical protein BGX28_004239 [Mortierella sp. GBA30]|nr:hypothetical protein BGX28_004239 [Mortierella sp. GBA30]